MVFDPYAPPPEQPGPPFPPPPPYEGYATAYPGQPPTPSPYHAYQPQYGWQPYPYAPPPRRRGRDVAVGLGIAGAGLAVLAFVWLLTVGGGIVTRTFEDDLILNGGQVEFPGDYRGPAFTLDLPPGWRVAPEVSDSDYRAILQSYGPTFGIGSMYFASAEPLEVALDRAANAVGETVDHTEVPRGTTVAGQPALIARLVEDDPEHDVWFAVFHGKGARWHARYTAPQGESVYVPPEFTFILGGLRW